MTELTEREKEIVAKFYAEMANEGRTDLVIVPSIGSPKKPRPN